MIIDTFMYFNEQDVAEIRMNELEDVVDLFVIGRGDITFSGKQNTHEFVVPDKFRDRTIIETHVLWQTCDAWTRERQLRGKMLERIEEQAPSDSTIIFTDVDEIPSAETVERAFHSNQVHSLNLDHYNYSFRYLKPHWECGLIAPANELFRMRPADLRMFRGESLEGGWHLSYFGDAEHVQQKLQAYSHTEFNVAKYTNLNRLRDCIENNIDIIDREPVEIEPRFKLPTYVTENKDRFKDYL